MRRWLSPAGYHWLALFAGLGVFATVLAWTSFGLINLAMANVGFLTRHGLMAVHEGGLIQLLQIGAKAVLALAAYLGFKVIETELIARWRGRGR